MDPFYELSAFVAVVETGGFSAAARKTGTAQSSVSKAVNALERRLGVVLLHRSTRRVHLTDQGRIYFDRTKPLLEEMALADHEITSSTLAVSGLVRIAAPSTFGRLHVLPLLGQLLAEHPGLRVDLVLSDALRDMVEDGIDLAIRLSTVNDPDSVVRRVAGTALVVAGARAYFDRHGIPRTPADLLQHNCIVYGDMHAWTFTGQGQRVVVPVRGNLTSNSVETLLAGVKHGIGLGMFHRASLTTDLHDADVVTVLDDFIDEPRDVSLVWPKRRFVPARVRSATDFFARMLPRQM